MLFCRPQPFAYWATIAHHDRQALPGLLHIGARQRSCSSYKVNKTNRLIAMN
jgi:hypothetical protein